MTYNKVDELKKQLEQAIAEQARAEQQAATTQEGCEERFSTGAIRTSVWVNTKLDKDGKVVHYRTINFVKRYQDKDNRWKNTNNMSVDELPKAIQVLQEAYRHCIMKESNPITEEVMA